MTAMEEIYLNNERNLKKIVRMSFLEEMKQTEWRKTQRKGK